MSARATVLVAPALPQVNLLPPEIVQARTLGVVKRWMVASVGVTAVAILTVTAVADVQTRIATSELAQAEAETAQLLAQQAPFAEVTAVGSQVDAVTAARDFALADEVLWADYLGALVAVTPSAVGITALEFRGARPLEVLPPSTDPLRVTGLGTLSFTALADDVPDAAAWADALDAVPGFSDARVAAVVLPDGTLPSAFTYEVTGSVRLDAAALSHRFDAQPEGDS